MVTKAKGLIQRFELLVTNAGYNLPNGQITHEFQPAPHEPHALPITKCAVYVFSLSKQYGCQCEAGPHRALKVGKAGPNSNARFQFHHYRPYRTDSSLAASLEKHRACWDHLGIHELSYTSGEGWILSNTDRDNFYLPFWHSNLLADLEKYLQAMLDPVFEGRISPLKRIARWKLIHSG